MKSSLNQRGLTYQPISLSTYQLINSSTNQLNGKIMNTKLPLTISLLTILVSFAACNTYRIPLDSFRQQFANKEKSREVTTQGPIGGTVKYNTYPIDIIKCVDKKGRAVELKNSPSLEIRFTDINNKKTIFYFDLLSVDENTVSGSRSRIAPGIQKSIPISNIKKIEVQDGKKNYMYVK
jgi:hypothetical protein